MIYQKIIIGLLLIIVKGLFNIEKEQRDKIDEFHHTVINEGLNFLKRDGREIE